MNYGEAIGEARARGRYAAGRDATRQVLSGPTSRDLDAAAALLGCDVRDVPVVVPLPFSESEMMMRYETDGLTQREAIVLFAHLIRTGKAWSLQGAFGRRAQSLIEAGAIRSDGTILYPLDLDVR